jgi:hypothetical protein
VTVTGICSTIGSDERARQIRFSPTVIMSPSPKLERVNT